MTNSKISTMLSMKYLFLLILSISAAGCRSSYRVESISPAFQFISDYALSSDGKNLALLIPQNQYRPEEGSISEWEIIIINEDFPQGRKIMEGFDNHPQNLQFSSHTAELYMIVNGANWKEPYPGCVDIWDISSPPH